VIHYITVNIWGTIEEMCKNEEGQCSYIIELINTIPEPKDLLNYFNQKSVKPIDYRNEYIFYIRIYVSYKKNIVSLNTISIIVLMLK